MKCYNTPMPIRGHIAAALSAAAFAALARTAELPPLPAPAFADAEVSTNMPMPTVERAAGTFSFSLTFAATPSNNVEAAFGADLDGDGGLSPAEIRLTVGWDCGRWFARPSPDAAPAAEALMPSDGSATALSWRLRVAPGGAPRSLTASADGAALFGGLSAAPPPWLYDPSWNLVRLTGRGGDVFGESFNVTAAPDGTAFILR